MRALRFQYWLVLGLILFLQACDQDSPVGNSEPEIIPLQWVGFSEIHPADPAQNWIYFNTTDKVSYLYTGLTWDTLALSGLDAPEVTWLGMLPTAPAVPVKNALYLNTTDRVTYIYNGTNWVPYNFSGDDGLFIEWKGTLEEAPTDPKLNWIFRHKSTNIILIFTGEHWEPFMYGGANGLALNWLGTFAIAPPTAQTNDAYYNSETKMSYIYTNFATWEVLSVDGRDGRVTFHWMGPLDVTPDPATLGPHGVWAYYNVLDGNSYVLNREKQSWDLLCIGGKNGVDGKNGIDGEDGVDGTGLIWMGYWGYNPSKPQKNWVYFNTKSQHIMIFNGTTWEVFLSAGKDGADAKPLIWKGELSYPPNNPERNWAYYNTSLGRSYIYDGYYWDLLASNGSDAKEKFFFDTTAIVSVGDTIKYHTPYATSRYLAKAQYHGKDSVIHSHEYIKPEWKGSYMPGALSTFYKGQKLRLDYHSLFALNDGTPIYAYNESQAPYQGLKAGVLHPKSGMGTVTSITNYEVKDVQGCSFVGQSYLLSFIASDTTSKGVVAIVNEDASVKQIIISDSIDYITAQNLDGNPLVYYTRNDSSFVSMYSATGDLIIESVVATSVLPCGVFQPLPSGELLLVYAAGGSMWSSLITIDGTLGTSIEITDPGGFTGRFQTALSQSGYIYLTGELIGMSSKGIPTRHRLRLKLDLTGALLENHLDVYESSMGTMLPLSNGNVMFLQNKVLLTYDANLDEIKEQKLSDIYHTNDKPLALQQRDGSILTVWNDESSAVALFETQDHFSVELKQIAFGTFALINNSPEALTLTLAIKEK